MILTSNGSRGRWTRWILLAAGLLLLLAALVLRLAVAPLVAQAPLVPGSNGFLNHVSLGTVTGLLDLDSGVARQPLKITRTETTRGDAQAAAAGGIQGFNVGVYSTISRILGADGTVIREDNYRLAADRRSQALVDCCGAFVNGVVVPMAGAGYPLRFPAFVARETYPYFDVNLLAAAPMRYLGEDTVEGMKAYKFQQSTTPTAVGRLTVPGQLVGSDRARATADRMYSVTRTFWVDPVTGIILRKAERTRETLRDAQGRDVVTLYAAELGSSAEQTAAEVQAARSAGRPILWSHTYGPLLLTLMGIALIAVAGLSWAAARRAEHLHNEFGDDWATFDDLHEQV